MEIKGVGTYPREIKIPGDKSISHRSIIFSSISKGITTIKNILLSEDVLMTIGCFRDMGVEIQVDYEKNLVVVNGVGLYGLKKPSGDLYCGNSGTTMRLMAGLLAGQKFDTVLIGDDSLNGRPMKRIISPLRMMGGDISGTKRDTSPLFIKGNPNLNSINYEMPMASGQVKSCIILASLYAEKDSLIREKSISRNHTELMLEYFRHNDWKVREINIPGDISSAAFFIAGGLINKGANILLRNIGLNETRTGILDIFLKMKGNIEIKNIKIINGEKIGDINIKYSKLQSVNIGGDIIGRMVDEVPILSVVSAFAEGKTLIKGAGELRFKETDRLYASSNELKKLGVDIKELKDGLEINKSIQLKPGIVKSYGDHRMAMALTVLAYNIDGTSIIEGSECVNISFPDFYKFFK